MGSNHLWTKLGWMRIEKILSIALEIMTVPSVALKI
jgi:hypothetical protein